MTDPVDDFQFKPLSQGLGFHKKAQSSYSASASASTPSATSPAPLSEGLLAPPLPRKSYPSNSPSIGKNPSPFSGNKNSGSQTSTLPFPAPAAISPKSDPVEDILRSLNKNKALSFENTNTNKVENTSTNKSKVSTPRRDTYKLSPWNFAASLLDAMLVAAITLLAMILVLVITKVDLIQVLSTADQSPTVIVASFLLIGTISLIYLVSTRTLSGSTPGEWAYEMRIGNPANQHTLDYALQVIARSLIVIATGFIVAPVISMIAGKDVLGHLTGAALYRRVSNQATQ